MTPKGANPYTEFTTVAEGDRFVGRTRLLADLVRVVAQGKASRAVVGLPRVGKSSLASQVFHAAEDDLNADCLWLDVSTLAGDRSLIEEIQHAVARIAGRYPEDGDAAHESLKQLLLEHRRHSRRIVLVLDEFDAIRMTHDVTLTVRRLRELIINPKRFGLTVVLVCRRDLETIEEKIPDLSNLANACPTVYLRPFDLDELRELTSRGFEAPESEDLAYLFGLTSGLPVLAEEALMHLHDGTDGDGVVHAMRVPTMNLFTVIRELMVEVGLWDDLVRVHTHGSSNFALERERLSAYGLVYEKDGGWQVMPALKEFVPLPPAPREWLTDAPP